MSKEFRWNTKPIMIVPSACVCRWCSAGKAAFLSSADDAPETLPSDLLSEGVKSSWRDRKLGLSHHFSWTQGWLPFRFRLWYYLKAAPSWVCPFLWCIRGRARWGTSRHSNNSRWCTGLISSWPVCWGHLRSWVCEVYFCVTWKLWLILWGWAWLF